MASLHISRFAPRPESAIVLRYRTAVVLFAVALGTALILRHDNLATSFTSFSFAAIAVTFWCAGTGPGLLALLLSYLALSDLFVPVKILGFSSESNLVIYGIFGAAVRWFGASRRRVFSPTLIAIKSFKPSWKRVAVLADEMVPPPGLDSSGLPSSHG
jgi:hypothetical protein